MFGRGYFWKGIIVDDSGLCLDDLSYFYLDDCDVYIKSFVIDGLFYWLIDWLCVSWLVGWLIDLMIEWLIDWLLCLVIVVCKVGLFLVSRCLVFGGENYRCFM